MDFKDTKLGFIGSGQMAEAIMKGLISKGLFQSRFISASDTSQARLDYMKETFGVNSFLDNNQVIEHSDIIILAVKPQVMKTVLEGISGKVSKHLIISIAAGVRLKTIEKHLPKGARVIRVMPNTPALIQAGAAGICKGENASNEDMKIALAIFEAIGEAVEVSESLIDAVTALSGSGPAYVFTFIEALVDAGIREGLARPLAQKLAIQTVLGSALLAKETGRHPAELTAMVTSPGGTTIEGLYGLEKGGLRAAVMDAVRMARKRSEELG